MQILVLIRDIIRQALTTSYVSFEAENQRRQLLPTKYDLEDLNAFMTLEPAAIAARIGQESSIVRNKASLCL